jgi:hypothetical protein
MHRPDGSIFWGDSHSAGSGGSESSYAQNTLVRHMPSTAPIFMNKNRDHIIDIISRDTRTTRCGVLLSEMRFATLGLFATLVLKVLKSPFGWLGAKFLFSVSLPHAK